MENKGGSLLRAIRAMKGKATWKAMEEMQMTGSRLTDVLNTNDLPTPVPLYLNDSHMTRILWRNINPDLNGQAYKWLSQTLTAPPISTDMICFSLVSRIFVPDSK